MIGNWMRTTCLWVLALAACGTGNFAEDFSDDISRDCIETVGCTQVGTVETCITRQAQTLNSASTTQQQYFVDTVFRCQGSRSCDWVNCSQSTNQTGYAALHLAQITYDCQQSAQCRITSGTAVTEDWVRQCIQEKGNMLNANPADQVAFDGRYARCSQQAACSWTACQ